MAHGSFWGQFVVIQCMMELCSLPLIQRHCKITTFSETAPSSGDKSVCFCYKQVTHGGIYVHALEAICTYIFLEIREFAMCRVNGHFKSAMNICISAEH